MTTITEHPQPPVRGLVAGKYEVLRIIGRGGMGSVWEGRHETLGTRVAIKFIDQEYAENEEARARFANEARAAATIQSKHAIHIYDHGMTEDGRPYIVMEMLTGEPLDKRLDTAGHLPLEETARILGQVCRGLQRAHDAGIIHRDLKPENIFLVRTPDDDDEIAKVLDFGIAKVKGLPGEKGLSSSTKTGAVMGTPFYMSPEQARGLRSIDTRSDLWSLGVIAYRCVTGAMPFDGESVGDLLVKVCTAPLPVPSVVMPGLPKSFDTWFAKALQREPDARFSTATQLADELALAAGLSVRRGPASSQRAQAPASEAAPAQSVGPSLAAATPTAALTSPPFVTSHAPPSPPRRTVLVVGAVGLVAGVLGAAALVKVLGAPSGRADAAGLAPSSSAVALAPVAPSTTSSAIAPATSAVVAAEAPQQLPAAAPNKLTAAPAWTPGRGTRAKGSPNAALPPATTAPATPAATPKPTPKPAPGTDDPGY